VWRILRKAELDYLETWRLNQDPLENTFDAICLHCGSNNNLTVSGLAFRGVLGTNFEENNVSLLENYIPYSRGMMLHHLILP
jgi:hypothetical protein